MASINSGPAWLTRFSVVKVSRSSTSGWAIKALVLHAPMGTIFALCIIWILVCVAMGKMGPICAPLGIWVLYWPCVIWDSTYVSWGKWFLYVPMRYIDAVYAHGNMGPICAPLGIWVLFCPHREYGSYIGSAYNVGPYMCPIGKMDPICAHGIYRCCICPMGIWVLYVPHVGMLTGRVTRFRLQLIYLCCWWVFFLLRCFYGIVCWTVWNHVTAFLLS